MTKVKSCNKLYLFKLLLVLLLVTITFGDESVCSADEGDCPAAQAPVEEVQGVCPRPSRTIYSQGGTAQAYKPNAPFSSTVCEPETAKQYKYKRASWSFSRSTYRKGIAPELDITIRFNSCVSKEGSKQQCQCYKVDGPSSPSDRVEVWQTRPDGRYSSLRSSDECRAQVQMNHQGTVKFTTVAPGSSGLMGGLGPSGFDWSP